MKFGIEIFNKIISVSFNIKRIRGEAVGYTNRCSSGYYIVSLDYDYMNESWITGELNELQRLFGLSNFYIFKTNKGCHAVCFDKVPLKTFVTIMKNSSVDPEFIETPLKTGYKMWNLRLTKKDSTIPKYVDCVPNIGLHQKSRAHMDLVENFFPDIRKDLDRNNQDDSKEVILRKYNILN